MESKEESLASRLMKATEKKDPGTNSKAAAFWDASDDDFETEKPKQGPKANTGTQGKDQGNDKAITQDPEENQASKPYSKEMGQASARVFVKMVDMGQQLVFKPILNFKFKKKFTPEERQRLKELEAVPEEQYTEEDKKLLAKYEKLAEKLERKEAEIPLQPDEEKDLENFTALYCDIKKKELPPEWGIAISLLVIIGKRTTDVFFD